MNKACERCNYFGNQVVCNQCPERGDTGVPTAPEKRTEIKRDASLPTTKQKMRRVCAWCGLVIDPGQETKGAISQQGVTHGICRKCYVKMCKENGIKIKNSPALVVRQSLTPYWYSHTRRAFIFEVEL
jgi:hypothetical protein